MHFSLDMLPLKNIWRVEDINRVCILDMNHSGRLAWKSFLSTIDAPPGSSGVSNEAKSFTKHATGGLVR